MIKVLSYRHLAYRIANADDIISLCDIYDIFGGGLLDFDFFHLDTYDTVDFQDTPDRSVLYLDAILVGRDFDRRGILWQDAQRSGGYFILGKYSTKEKAMKVLDMIQEAYCKFMSVKNDDAWSGKESVFYMPEDSEVEA